MNDLLVKARAALKGVFGYESFVSVQADVVARVLAGGDALVVMPTGGGKSICYQLPALLWDGLTVVVSPLISLMTDQVAQLQHNGVAALVLHSALAAGDYRRNLEQIQAGRVKLLYAAPETLVKDALLERLPPEAVRCLAVDEAHCISAWGHDFRPEYRQLARVRQRWPQAVCLALTATATARVRQDIRASLGIGPEAEFVAGFDRPNLFLQVAAKQDPHRQTLAMIRRHAGQPGIVYCATRSQVDRLTERLQADGILALGYHAGMADGDRRRHQERFSRDDVQVMVATVAFGMGIDKSNVRFVVHYDLPKNIESYYQEIGRAGRDGARADGLLLFSYGDIRKVRYLIAQMEPGRQRTANLLLTAMLRYVESDQCRRRVLLDYFGEEYAHATCAMCDNCLSEKPALRDLTTEAQKLLSCVKRTGETFGVAHVVDVLRGSQARKVQQRGHHRLTTYGIGRELGADQWRDLARQLLQGGFLTQDLQIGSLQLTPKAWELFRGQRRFQGRLKAPSVPGGQNAPTAAVEAADPALFERLRRLRKQLADTAGVPPFVVFSDRTLLDMTARRPQSPESLMTVHGIGRIKAERYGAPFLEILRDSQSPEAGEGSGAGAAQPSRVEAADAMVKR